MTLVQYLFETGPQDTALSNGNSGSSASSIGSGSSAVFDAAMKAHGTFGARFINGAAANCYRRYPFAAANVNWRFSGVITLPASAPAANVIVASAANAGGFGRVQLVIDTSLRLCVQQVGGANTPITTALTGGAKYRVTLVITGGSTTASTVTVKVYSGTTSWTTQVGSTYTSTTFNAGTDAAIGMDIGVINSPAASYAVGWDDIQVSDGSGGEIGDLVVPLATPTVTLGTTVNPTTVGGTDGTQQGTWGAVSGAGSYRALIAAGSTPDQGDFTVVATGVTSPYTWTGLAAGEYAFGIQAMP